MILVQQIETIWGKKSRASEQAVIRNSVPESFEYLASSDNDNIHQLLQFEEKTGFETPKSTVKTFDGNTLNNFFGALRLYKENDTLKVKYTYSPEKVGAPERTVYPKEVLSLKTGEWGKIVYTGRFSGSYNSYGEWFYKKVVFNIANLENANISIFKTTRPKKTFEDIANLR